MGSKRVKILLIEDDPFLLSMYSAKFELGGFAVVTADNGEDGVVSAKGERPDLILLDIVLPKMSGLDVLQKLKTDNTTASIPVIILTNLNQKDEIERGMALGASDYLIKAHTMPSEVVERIKKILGA
jgi:DNA-binding response OmpR family regulator